MMKYKSLEEIPCPCCGENSLRWAKDRNYITGIPFVWINCYTCDFEFGAGWNRTNCENLLSDFECYLKNLNNDKKIWRIKNDKP